MKNLIIIFMGGGLGSMARYMIARTVYLWSTAFPLGTLAVNVISCIVLGIFVGLANDRYIISPAWRLFVAVGFCGGFSTFSTFSYETMELFKTGQYLYGFTNIFGNLILCLASILCGLLIAKLF